MKNVLIVSPSTKEALTNTRWVTASLGCHYLSSWLNNHNHFASVWDINIDNVSLEDTIKSKNWDIIAFSSQESTLEYDLANINMAKRVSSKSILVAGGTGPTVNYQTYFNHSPLDIVIQAEGEYALLRLCDLLDEKGYENAPLHTIQGIIIRSYAKVFTPDEYWEIRKDLDVKAMRAEEYWSKTSKLYEIPDFNEINTFRLYTSNYCPMQCAFCTLSRLRKYSCGKYTPVITLKAFQVVELISKVLQEYKDCRRIFFVDDDFFISKQRGKEFCELVISLKKKNELPEYLKFICLTNINRIDEDNIDLIAQAGFRILSVGVESLSQHVLDSMDKKQSVEKIWKTTELILNRGIKPYYTLLAFTPFCTFEDLLTDIIGFKKLGQMGVGLSLEPYLIPLKGTRLSEEGVEERKRCVNIEGTNDFIYKSFAWLPQNPEVRKIFKRFEIIYPKYRRMMFGLNKGKHFEKNWQAYVILDAIVMTVREIYGEIQDLKDYGLENWKDILEKLECMEQCNVDIIGEITK